MNLMIDTKSPIAIIETDTYASVLLSCMALYLDQRREHETILDIIRRRYFAFLHIGVNDLVTKLQIGLGEFVHHKTYFPVWLLLA